jgi:hypothetical protein
MAMPRPKWRFIKAEFDCCDNAAALFACPLRMQATAPLADANGRFRGSLPSNPTLRERYFAGK